MEKGEVERPVIVAMKGHPCTGKSTLARSIAEALRCPLVDFDDVCSCTATIHQSLSASTTTAAEQLHDFTFEAIWRIASTQLRMKLSVVIDSPLSHNQAHLNRLLELAASTETPLFVIECKAQDESQWRSRLEQRGGAADGTTWYKPSAWEDLNRMLEGYDGHADYIIDGIPKLVVDTTAPLAIAEHVAAVMEFIFSNKKSNNIDKIDSAQEEEESKGEGETGLTHFSHCHPLTFSEEHENGDRVACQICGKPISGPAYSCVQCDYLLHKSCADLPQHMQIQCHKHSLITLSPSSSRGDCVICFDSTGPFYTCDGGCFMFYIHYKCSLLPSVLQHECHEHSLRLRTFDYIHDYIFWCEACGGGGYDSSYNCSSCGSHFHVKCASAPQTLTHKSHMHPLFLSVSPRDDSGEYYCDVCEKERNPNHWIYYCRDCDYAAHMSCVTSEVQPYHKSDASEDY